MRSLSHKSTKEISLCLLLPHAWSQHLQAAASSQEQNYRPALLGTPFFSQILQCCTESWLFYVVLSLCPLHCSYANKCA